MGAPQEEPSWILGTWISISHQTIQVVQYEADGSFNATYFTPHMNVKSCLEGQWKIEGDLLHTHYVSSVPPVMKVPMEDADTLTREGEDRFYVQGVNGGIKLTFDRVIYRSREEVYPGWNSPKQELKDAVAPTREELLAFTPDDLWEDNILMPYLFATIEKVPGELYDEKVRVALTDLLKPAAGNLYLINTFLGMWGNGGMQHVLLCEEDECERKEWELCKTVNAFRSYGCVETARFLDDLIPKAMEWSTALGELTARENDGEEVDEALFEEIWDRVDAFDEPFEQGFPQDPDVFEMIHKDITQHPEKYIG